MNQPSATRDCNSPITPFNLSGVAEIGGETSPLLGESLRIATDRVAAQLPAYIGGTGLRLTAVGVWWWAERAH